MTLERSGMTLERFDSILREMAREQRAAMAALERYGYQVPRVDHETFPLFLTDGWLGALGRLERWAGQWGHSRRVRVRRMRSRLAALGYRCVDVIDPWD